MKIHGQNDNEQVTPTRDAFAGVQPPRGSESKKLLLSFAVGLIIGLGAMWLWSATGESQTNGNGVSQETTTEESGTATTNTASASAANALGAPGNTTTHENNALAISNQAAGKTVAVDRVTVAEASWVVVHEIADDGALQNALGAGWFPQGESSGVLQLLRGTTAGNVYVALLYSDDGDRVFEFRGDDAPLTSADGHQIAVTFTAR